MLRSCNLACRWREGSGGRLGGSGGISDAMRGAFEWIWIPGQQARVVVALRRLLGIFIDDFCGHTLKSTLFGLRRVGLFDARLGLSVDEGGHRGQL